MKKRREHEAEEKADETWLIPYSDLLTLLLALFVVLFASSQIDQKKFDQLGRSLNVAFHGGDGFVLPSKLVPELDPGRDRDESKDESRKQRQKGAATDEQEMTAEAQEFMEKFNQETENLEHLKQQIDVYIFDNELTDKLETHLNSEMLRIRISDNALFASGSATVRPEARQIAEAISNVLEQSPGYQIIISGHTDNVPINTAEFPSNWDLSTRRATNFLKILLRNDNLSPERFSAVGYGEYQPVADNDSPEGRAQNRRVEVSIMRMFQKADSNE